MGGEISCSSSYANTYSRFEPILAINGGESLFCQDRALLGCLFGNRIGEAKRQRNFEKLAGVLEEHLFSNLKPFPPAESFGSSESCMSHQDKEGDVEMREITKQSYFPIRPIVLKKTPDHAQRLHSVIHYLCLMIGKCVSGGDKTSRFYELFGDFDCDIEFVSKDLVENDEFSFFEEYRPDCIFGNKVYGAKRKRCVVLCIHVDSNGFPDVDLVQWWIGRWQRKGEKCGVPLDPIFPVLIWDAPSNSPSLLPATVVQYGQSFQTWMYKNNAPPSVYLDIAKDVFLPVSHVKEVYEAKSSEAMARKEIKALAQWLSKTEESGITVSFLAAEIVGVDTVTEIYETCCPVFLEKFIRPALIKGTKSSASNKRKPRQSSSKPRHRSTASRKTASKNSKIKSMEEDDKEQEEEDEDEDDDVEIGDSDDDVPMHMLVKKKRNVRQHVDDDEKEDGDSDIVILD